MDKEKLINLVNEHPVLWNKKLRRYYDRSAKAKIWEEVGEELNASGPEAKKKWECLRDQFRRELKRSFKRNSGAADNEYMGSSWTFFKDMMFLKDTVLLKETKSKISKEEIVERSSDEQLGNINNSERDNDLSLRTDADGTLNTFEIVDEPTTSCMSRTQKPRFKEQIIEIEKKKVELFQELLEVRKNEEKTAEDDDYYFVMSVLPHLRRIKVNKKMKIRANIMDLIYRELDAEESS